MATGNRRGREEPKELARQIAGKVADKLSSGADHVGRLTDAAERLNSTAARISDKADRMAERAAREAASLDRLAAHLDAIDVWTRVEPGARKPRYTREEIAEAAIAIADVEGFDAVSMRRIAAELGAGTMTLYHYVRTKDELLTLINDTLMGEVVLGPGERLPGDWREAMTIIATRSRNMLRRHPWVLDIADDPPIGPNSVLHFDQSMQAIESYPGTFDEKLDVVTAVDEYVFGFCSHERTNYLGEGVEDQMAAYLAELMETGDYPHLSSVIADRPVEDVLRQINEHASGPGRFERTLSRLLDGFEPPTFPNR